MIIKGKVALITGGVSGLGLSFAKTLLKNGLKGVCLADVNVKAGQEVIPLLEEEFGQNKAIFVKVDVTDKTEFEDTFKKTVEAFNCIDIVINSAGIANERDFKTVIDINLNAVISGTQLAMDKYLPMYSSSKEESVVINISSIYGLDGCEYGVGYTASKHGVLGLSKALGTERHYRETGVKILTICPGFCDTPILYNIEQKILPGRYNDIYKEELCETQVPLLKPDEVSKALIKILEHFETGSVWLIEDGECCEVKLPTRFTLEKKNVFQI